MCPAETMGSLIRIATWLVAAFIALIAVNLVRQLLPRNKREPPTVFHWIPLIGNAVEYGMDPYSFFVRCQAKVS